MINPFQSKAFSNSRLLRTKNDKVDAGLLACYCAISKPKETTKTSKEVKTLRRLVRYLNTLIEERAREKTRLHSVRHNYVANVVKATIEFYSQMIEKPKKKLRLMLKLVEN